MADADDVRRLALALEHVTEIESDGFDFRVANKGDGWPLVMLRLAKVDEKAARGARGRRLADARPGRSAQRQRLSAPDVMRAAPVARVGAAQAGR